MELPLPPEIEPTNEMLRLVSGIDEFKGEWQAQGNLNPERLNSLRRVATIESVGSSTRIEGARLNDVEVEMLLGNLQTESFQSRDEQEVAGYAYVMETVQSTWQDLEISENILLQLHRDLLRYSSKDERHRGGWKTLPNHVAAFDADGNKVGIVFETATPFETPDLTRKLLDWLRLETSDPILHPLIRIAVFKVAFLAIHPFQDGNGRLSRVLTNLLLLRAKYAHASFSSLESVIEHNKEAYYLALRRTQTSFRTETADWEPWIQFFLRAMKQQVERLQERLPTKNESEQTEPIISLPDNLSPLAGKLYELLRQRRTLSVAEASDALGANRNTLKGKFAELVKGGYAELRGKGRGAHYLAAKQIDGNLGN